MAGFGMIGALGGAGAALGKEADYLYKEDEKAADDNRARSLQSWLMAKRDEYAIASEKRAEVRDVAKEERGEKREVAKEDRAAVRRETEKDNDNARYIREAEGRRNVVVEDDKAKARAKSAVAAETLDTDVKVEAGHAEGSSQP